MLLKLAYRVMCMFFLLLGYIWCIPFPLLDTYILNNHLLAIVFGWGVQFFNEQPTPNLHLLARRGNGREFNFNNDLGK